MISYYLILILGGWNNAFKTENDIKEEPVSDDDSRPNLKRERHDSDSEIPRRKRHDSDADTEIPRRKRHDSDLELDRRKKTGGSESDISPPRRR